MTITKHLKENKKQTELLPFIIINYINSQQSSHLDKHTQLSPWKRLTGT